MWRRGILALVVAAVAARVAGAPSKSSLPDVQCYETRYGSFLKGTIRMAVPGSEKSFEGEGMFAWDAANGRITFWNWASDGSYGTGTATLVGGDIHFDLAAAASPTRTIWRRIDKDSFRVVKERKESDAWKPVLTSSTGGRLPLPADRAGEQLTGVRRTLSGTRR